MKYKKLRLTKIRIAGATFVLVLIAQAAVPFLTPSASAGTLANTLVRFDRLAANQTTSGMVCAKPTNVAATYAHVQVTFPGTGTVGATSFGVNSTAANWTTTTTNLPNGASAWPGIGTATAVSGASVTFPSGNLTSSTTLYCFNFTGTSTLATPTAAAPGLTGTVTTQDSTPATIDSGSYGVDILGANADQVTVNATVNPAFTLALTNTTDSLGTLTVGAVASSTVHPTATINTNAANGWYLWGKDLNQGLKSTIAGGYTIPSVTTCTGGVSTNSTLSAGTEGYNLGVTATSQAAGTGTVSTTGAGLVFDNASGTPGKGAGLCSTAYQTIATSNGTASNSLLTFTNNAAISGITKPGTDYTDTETFVGAGLF